MRPYRIGTSSGRRVAAWRSSASIGSERSSAGSHSAWLERGTRERACLPSAARSPAVLASACSAVVPTSIPETYSRATKVRRAMTFTVPGRASRRLRERDADQRPRDHVAGIMHTGMDPGVGHHGRETAKRDRGDGGDTPDAVGERERRRGVPGGERAGDRHADVAGDGDLLRDPVGSPPPGYGLQHQIHDRRCSCDGSEPAYRGATALAAPDRHQRRGRREREPRVVGRPRQPAHCAIERRRGCAGDRGVDRHVEPLRVLEPAHGLPIL